MKKLMSYMIISLVLLSIIPLFSRVERAAAISKTYTLDADFDEGTLIGVEHDTVSNQLQLSREFTTLPFIWIPNNEGTVSKVNTSSGRELGRYWVSSGSGSSPSRTTVDLDGNCWVGCRQRGTVVKIGLFEAGQWKDRNGDGICQTSNDTNSDGDLTGAEILPWGQDECVLYEVVLIPGHEGTYAPGAYSGPYDYDFWGVAPRGLAIDAKNNLWAGTWSTGKYFYINGTTGTIIETVDIYPHNAYGAVMDKKGVLWSASGWSSYHDVLAIDASTGPPTITAIPLPTIAYGLSLDYQNHTIITGFYGKFYKININNYGDIETIDCPEAQGSKGVVVTGDNNTWIANCYDLGVNTVTRYDNDGNLIATITGVYDPTGLAVDANGKVWVTSRSDEYLYRIDPALALGTVDILSAIDLPPKRIVGSGGHYSYSDMTGIISRTITTKIGTWTVIYDSETADTSWGTISWISYEPEGTSVTAKVRSSNDQSSWSLWETAINGVPLSTTPDGRYLQIETTLKIIAGEVSPILYDLSIQSASVGIPATVDINPNALNLKSKGKWITCYIELPEGYDVADINVSTIKLNDTISAQLRPRSIGDHNNNGIPDLMVKFNRAEVISYILANVDIAELIEERFMEITLTVTGSLNDDTPFEGTDTIRIIYNMPRYGRVLETIPN